MRQEYNNIGAVCCKLQSNAWDLWRRVVYLICFLSFSLKPLSLSTITKHRKQTWFQYISARFLYNKLFFNNVFFPIPFVFVPKATQTFVKSTTSLLNIYTHSMEELHIFQPRRFLYWKQHQSSFLHEIIHLFPSC